MVGEDSCDGQGENGGQREAGALAAAGIGHLREGGAQVGRWDGDAAARSCGQGRGSGRLHGTLPCVMVGQALSIITKERSRLSGQLR